MISPKPVRYPSANAGKSPRITMQDLEATNMMSLEARMKKVISFILAIASIGLTAMMFVMLTKFKKGTRSPVGPHGFEGQE